MTRPVPPLYRHYFLQQACRVPDESNPSWDAHYHDEYPPLHVPLGPAYILHVDKHHNAFVARTYSDPAFVAGHAADYVRCGDIALCYLGTRYSSPQALYEQVLAQQPPDRTGRLVRTRWFDATYGDVWQLIP